jgi:hypothetical protein
MLHTPGWSTREGNDAPVALDDPRPGDVKRPGRGGWRAPRPAVPSLALAACRVAACRVAACRVAACRVAASLVAACLLAVACDRPPPSPARASYDADSAARGLLAPPLATALAVEPLLAGMRDTSAAAGRRCQEDTLAGLRHVRLRFDVRQGDTATTIFVRRTPDGELRRAEVLRRLPDGTALGLSWDAAEHATTVSEFSGGTVKKTTSRDAAAPLARALRYVGRRALGTKCGNRESGIGNRR